MKCELDDCGIIQGMEKIKPMLYDVADFGRIMMEM